MTQSSRPWDFARRFFIAEIAVFAVGALLVWLFIGGLFADHWKVDFRYFWSAGRLWLDGVSPYSSAYVQYVEDEFHSEAAAFFYPPSIIPVFALFGALPPPTAAYAFFAVNLIFAGLSALLAADLAVRIGAVRNRLTAFAVLLPLLTLTFHPALSALLYGQTSLMIALAFAVFIRGLQDRRPLAAGLGLAVLLMKPQFSIGLLIAALLKKEFRAAGLIGLGVNAALCFLGALPDPVGSMRDFAANISVYGDSKWNLSENSAGLGFLLSFAGLSLSPVLSLAATAATALAAAQRLPKREHDDERLALVMILILAVSMTASFNHSNDYVLFAPAAAFAFSARHAHIRLLLVVAYAAMALTNRIHPVGAATLARC